MNIALPAAQQDRLGTHRRRPRLRPLAGIQSRGLEYQVVSQAPARGRQVTGMVRRAEAWATTTTGLSAGEGAAGDDLSSGSRAVAGQGAAIRALGDPPWWAGRKGPATVGGARTGRAA
ncbi:NAD(P)-dependent oxidoreductase [Streptomyces coeruleorubidus]|uniref:Uncharacterized protein n=1 Tax=Streptomyces coeruleorubidus TaxID=116188 RepID=A0ABZ0K5I7_STRC4|nr:MULTISPECIES: hypothetical protein [Streptomyces]WOT33191.1 hypothetical protein R5U08_03110 [Streptomyces coeruleorubidus]GGT93072.1 hypothetical protein GCM10010244_17870 [Streptomyces bellus]